MPGKKKKNKTRKRKFKKPGRPAKHIDALKRIRERLEGRYRDTRHASDRKAKRTISLLEC